MGVDGAVSSVAQALRLEQRSRAVCSLARLHCFSSGPAAQASSAGTGAPPCSQTLCPWRRPLICLHVSSTSTPACCARVALCVCVQVLDFLGHVTICQRYQNLTAGTISCEYWFPLDTGAAVNRLLITVGGRVIEGVVQERDTAKATCVLPAGPCVVAGAHWFVVPTQPDGG